MPDANITAQLDQMQQGLENIAKILGNYYKTLIGEGIPENLAASLVIDLQYKLIPDTKRPDND